MSLHEQVPTKFGNIQMHPDPNSESCFRIQVLSFKYRVIDLLATIYLRTGTLYK